MRLLKKVLLIGFVTVAVIFLLIFALVYFSVDDRVEIKPTLSPFKNEKSIVRLDSIVISPDSIDRLVRVLMDKAHVHGMAIQIVNRYDVVYQNFFGFRNKSKMEQLTPGTIFYGASFSKTIFADIVLQLVEDKIIHLDTPLVRYLAKPLFTYKTNFLQQLFGSNFINYSDLEGDIRFEKITPRMCLNHTTGLPNWRWFEDDKKLKIKYEPGIRYSYSGEGMFLLQMVIEELTGRSIEEIAVEKVFFPLDLPSTSYVWQRAYEGHYAVGHDTPGNNLRIPKNNVPNAAGSLSTTLEDYGKFFLSILKQKSERYLELTTPQITISSKQQFGLNAKIDTHDNDTIRLAYGLGFGLYKTPYGRAFFKEGHLEGWQHYAVGFPSQGVALIMMSNSDNAESIFKELIEYTTGNTFTPWFWEGYIPYDSKDLQ
ncbi:MAG: serine hydrolase [Marivirga sp.]|nr:serine hydrolase [Marivirga sp.]